jgi:hypothetical protein
VAAPPEGAPQDDGAPEEAATNVPAARAGATGEEPQALDSLDEYFDRLDAAFSEAAASSAPVEPPASPQPPAGAVESTGDLDAEFGAWDIPFEPSAARRDAATPESEPNVPSPSEPASSGQPVSPSSAGAASTLPTPPNEIPVIAPEQTPVAQAPALADAFVALLAAEQRVGPVPVSFAPIGVAAPSTPVDERTVEDIVRRVVARMTEETVRSTVLDVAERLVREEIDRIKQQAKL